MSSTQMDMNHTTTTMSMDMDMNMNMQMFFYLSSSVTILFSEWTTNTWAELLGSCAAVFVLAALYEGLKVAREILMTKSRQHQSEEHAQITPTGSQSSKGGMLYTDSYNSTSVRRTMCSVSHILQSLLHVVQVSVSYLLMLVAMTYNGWLFISIVTGAGFGYFLFSWKRVVVVDVNEHCN